MSPAFFILWQGIMTTYVDIGPWSLTTYSLFHAAGVLSAGVLSVRELRRLGFSVLSILGTLVLFLLFTHLAAHTYHVVTHRALFLTNPRGLFNFWNRGLAFHGGLVGAGLAILLAARLSRRAAWELADAFAPPAALALVFFRLGCYSRGCCHGLPCGEDFPLAGWSTGLIRNQELSLHPTQLYAATAALVLFVLLRALRRRKLFQGELVIVFLLYISTQRFLIEFLRESHLRERLPFTVLSLQLNMSQVFALGFFLLGLVLLALRRRALRDGLAAARTQGK